MTTVEEQFLAELFDVELPPPDPVQTPPKSPRHFRAGAGKALPNKEESRMVAMQNIFDDKEVSAKAAVRILKSNIQRDKVRQHQFKAPKRTHQELFSEKVQAGPVVQHLFEDEDLIDVRGGDGSAPIMRDFVGFVPALAKNIAEMGIERPTLVQKCVIPIIAMKPDYDLMVRAETGSGKTAAYLFPIIHLLEMDHLNFRDKLQQKGGFAPETIIISPIRELAQQLGDSARTYTRGTSLHVITSYGEMRVADTLAEVSNAGGCNIFACTMGRLMQFVREGKLKLSNLRFLVLDEADKLVLDAVFKRDLDELKQTIGQQNETPPRILMFSATYVDNENNINQVLRPHFFRVFIGSNDNLTFANTVKQKLIEVRSKQGKFDNLMALLDRELRSGTITASGDGVTWRRLKQKVVIFCNSKRVCNWLALKLSLKRYKAIPTNGDRSQKQRQAALEQFERGDCDLLISTNVTSRGLNIAGVGLKLIINFELPSLLEDYVHRIGRTGRAGNIGRALSFIDLDSTADVLFRNKLVESMVKLGKSPPKIHPSLVTNDTFDRHGPPPSD